MGIFVMEATWSDDIHDQTSVLPFVKGFCESEGLEFSYRQFHDASSAEQLLVSFINSDQFEQCYVAGHGSGARLGGQKRNINLNPLARNLAGRRRPNADIRKGVLFGACEVGIALEDFKKNTTSAIEWVAGYSTTIPWFESTIADLMFMKYIAKGYVHLSYDNSSLPPHLTPTKRLRKKKSDLSLQDRVDTFLEDFPLAKDFGFEFFK